MADAFSSKAKEIAAKATGLRPARRRITFSSNAATITSRMAYRRA